MYTVYILFSKKYNKIYIGITSNLPERFKSHNELGKKGWTIKFRPWEVAYTEIYASRSEASQREKFLKTATGRQFAWQQVTKYLNGL